MADWAAAAMAEDTEVGVRTPPKEADPVKGEEGVEAAAAAVEAAAAAPSLRDDMAAESAAACAAACADDTIEVDVMDRGETEAEEAPAWMTCAAAAWAACVDLLAHFSM